MMNLMIMLGETRHYHYSEKGQKIQGISINTVVSSDPAQSPKSQKHSF